MNTTPQINALLNDHSLLTSPLSSQQNELILFLNLISDEQVRYLHQEQFILSKLEKVNHSYMRMVQNLRDKGITAELIKSLTTQEKTILKLIADGLQTKEIASNLHISNHTVQTHRKNMYKKLNLNTISDLVKLSLLLELK